MLHGATIVSNAMMNAFTTNDLFLKDNTYNTIMIIGLKEEYTNSLREFFLNIPSYNDMNSLTDQFRKYSENNLTKLAKWSTFWGSFKSITF